MKEGVVVDFKAGTRTPNFRACPKAYDPGLGHWDGAHVMPQNPGHCRLLGGGGGKAVMLADFKGRESARS
jgi:hypothetical protein